MEVTWLFASLVPAPGCPRRVRDPHGDSFETLTLCRERFRHQNVELSVSAIPEGLNLHGHPVQVAEALLQLLRNAIDAVAELDEKWVRFEATREAGAVVFSVIDSGRGVPAELRERIMTPFFTTKPAGEGSGLGLSVCRTIAEQHGGELVLDASSRHTCFRLRRPLAR